MGENSIIFRKIFRYIIILCFLTTAGPSSFGETHNKTVSYEDPGQDRILVTYPETGDSRFFSGSVEGVIQAPLCTVWRVLYDLNNYYEFFPSMTETFIVDDVALDEISKRKVWTRSTFEAIVLKHRIEKPMADTFYFYNVIKMPFPVPDRWLLFKVKCDPEEYYISWTLVYGNMLISDGSWKLSACGRNSSETLAAYKTQSKSVIPIPLFVMNIGLNKTLPEIIRGLRRRVIETSSF